MKLKLIRRKTTPRKGICPNCSTKLETTSVARVKTKRKVSVEGYYQFCPSKGCNYETEEFKP